MDGWSEPTFVKEILQIQKVCQTDSQVLPPPSDIHHMNEFPILGLVPPTSSPSHATDVLIGSLFFGSHLWEWLVVTLRPEPTTLPCYGW